MPIDENGHEYFCPIVSTRRLVAELRGVDHRTVHLRGVIGHGEDRDEAWGYAELMSDATVRAWESIKNHPK